MAVRRRYAVATKVTCLLAGLADAHAAGRVLPVRSGGV